MTSIDRITGIYLDELTSKPGHDPVWALEFVPGKPLAAYTAPEGSLTDADLRAYTAERVTARCVHDPEPVWSGVILSTPWKFMRCPIEFADDLTLPEHPINTAATAFIRRVEADPCPCQWHGRMVIAYRHPYKHRHQYKSPAAIPDEAVTAAIEESRHHDH